MIGAFGIIAGFVAVLFLVNGDILVSLTYGIVSLIFFILKILEDSR